MYETSGVEKQWASEEDDCNKVMGPATTVGSFMGSYIICW